MTNRELIGRALLRERFFVFLKYAFEQVFPHESLSAGPYLEAFAFVLEQGARGRRRRLVINMPPRHLKSFALVCLQAWMLGRDPSVKIIAVSYGEELARKLTETFRAIVRSHWYRAIFPEMVIDSAGDRLDEVRTLALGYRRSATVGGPLTGFGGDVIITDDITKAQDANSPAMREAALRFFEEVLFSRFNNPAAGIFIAAQQRLHTEDIVARLVELPGFHVLDFPAIAENAQTYDLYAGRVWRRTVGELLDPQRFPLSVLNEARARNRLVFAAQYQQAPELAISSMIDLSEVRFIDECPPEHSIAMRLCFWDTAVGVDETNDYSVGICCVLDVENDRWMLVDMIRGRLPFPRLKAVVIELADRWAADATYVENASSGGSLVQQLRHEGHAEVHTVGVSDSKEERFFCQTGFLQSDRFAVLGNASWTPDLRRELGGYPFGKHDDIVDAISLFANYIQSQKGRFRTETHLNGGVRLRRRSPRRGFYR